MGIIRYKDVPYGGGGSSVTPNPSGTATANLEKVQIESTVYAIKDSNAVHGSDKGTANGVASLDANGKVPSAQLPSYVDDVVEGYYDTTTDRFYEESTFTTVIPPEDGKSWVDVSSNKSYRWTGSVYVRVDEGVQLGETSNTAYRGDRGKTAYDHATESGKISAAVASGLYKIAATAEGHIASLTAVVKADITALGITDENVTPQYYESAGGNYYVPFVTDDTNQQPMIDASLNLTISRYSGTTHHANLQIGNVGDTEGTITFATTDSGSVTLHPTRSSSVAAHFYFPEVSGTIALTSDIPTKTSDLTNDSGYVTTDEKITCTTVNPQTATSYSIPFVTDTTNQKPSVDDGFLHAVKSGTTSDVGYSTLKLGNTTASGTNGNKCGILTLCSEKSGYAQLRASENITAGRVAYLPDANGTLALTSDIPTKTSDLTNDSGYITNSALSSYLPLTGGTLTGNLKVGNPADTSTFPSYGITVHDTRDADHAPSVLQKAVNFFFSHTGTPNSDWWAGMMVRGWTGTGYNSWELVGPASINNQSTTPLYVRTSNGSSWGSWRQIYDSSNKPSFSDLGIGTIGTVNLGSGSSKFLREDGQWTTVTATDSTKLPLAGGEMTGRIDTYAPPSDIMPAIMPKTAFYGSVGFSNKPYRFGFFQGAVLGASYEEAGTSKMGILTMYTGSGARAVVITPDSNQSGNEVDLTLPSASGTLITDTYLNSNITYFISEYKDFKNLASGSSVTLTITNTSEIKVGFITLCVCHCGASSITMNAPFWSVSGIPFAGSRNETNVPIAKVWDNTNIVTYPIFNLTAATRTLTFKNQTGIATNPTYNSRVIAALVKLR